MILFFFSMGATMVQSIDNGGQATRRPLALCIDDDPEISLALSVRLGNLDVEVLRAFHGTHGFWLAQTEKPDLIITDISMPMGDGEFVIDGLKNNVSTKHIPIFVLTGRSEQGWKKRMQKLGAEAFFVKPIAFEELRERLEDFIPLAAPELTTVES